MSIIESTLAALCVIFSITALSIIMSLETAIFLVILGSCMVLLSERMKQL